MAFTGHGKDVVLWSLTEQEIPGGEDGLPERPNTHCLDRLIQAAPARELVASEDIRDQRGVLLWASGQPVDAGLRERLIARRLLRPLESSLVFRDTLAAMDVLACARRVLDEQPAVASLLGPDTQQVLAILGQARLLKGPGMLLTALAQDRPAAFAHAVLVALINIWLAIGLGRGESGLLDAAESGLMHDLGEFYLAPDVLQPVGRMSFQAWRALSVHPLIGCALIREAGGVYDEALAVAVREHHERIDGSGYPTGSRGISPLGRLLLSAEVLATLLTGANHVLVRARIGLQMIPGQFPREVVGLVAARARLLPHDPPESVDAGALRGKVSAILQRLDHAAAQARALRADAFLAPAEQTLLERLGEQISRYTMAMHDCGAEALAGQHGWLEADPQAADEVFRVVREMGWQLPGLHRHAELMVRARTTRPERWQALLDALDDTAAASAARGPALA